MKKLYFKVYIDFTKYIPIDDSELEKALYAFQIGKPVIFENGAATRIENIIPDFNKSLGWYSDYKPTAEDNSYIENIRPSYTGYVGKIKDKIQYLIQEGKTGLIGKNIVIPELEHSPSKEISNGAKLLADKFKI